MGNPTLLRYTKQLPTAPGYYWLKLAPDYSAQVVFVYFSDNGEFSCWFIGSAGYETAEYLQRFPKAKWAGPIPSAED